MLAEGKIKDILISLENLATDFPDFCSMPCELKMDVQALLNAIKVFSDKNKGKKQFKNQITLCLKLLEDSENPFGGIVFLYAFLHKDKIKSFFSSLFESESIPLIQCVTKALGFSSRASAAESLYEMIFSVVGKNKNVFDKLKEFVITPIKLAFHNNTELNIEAEDYHSIALSLNFFEAKIEQSKKPSASLEQTTLQRMQRK